MKITGAEVIARALLANGVTQVFNVPGFGIHPLIQALKKHRSEFSYNTAPNETAVALMADGYGRVTGKPAFVNVYHASGTALAMMGVTTAWADRSPMLFTTTTTSRRLERSDGYASVPRDITEATRQFTKWDWEVPSVDRIPEAIARAVILSRMPPMGPVHLAFPLDLYTEEVEESIIDEMLMARPDRLNIFNATVADPAGIEAAARLLMSAKTPVIVSGGDVAQHDAVDELVTIAELLDAPVFGEPYVAYMGFPNTHRLFAGRFSGNSTLLKEADVVFVVGAELTGGSGAPLLPPAHAKVIFLTTDAMNFAKQIWADVGLVGHPKSSLHALLRALKEAGKPPQKPQWVSKSKTYIEAYRERLAVEINDAGKPEGPVRLPVLIKEIANTFGDDAIFLDHSTTGTAYILDMAEFANPRRYFGISARASAQGWGTPAAIGMQIGAPDKRVVAVVGDGGFMFTSTTLYAAAQWATPVVIVVLSNGGWHDVAYGAKKNRGWTEQDVKDFGWVCEPQIDYAGLAKSLGIRSYRADTTAELQKALVAARDGVGPSVIEMKSDPEATAYYLSFIAA
ncbi:MAG: thiamine pyrophosphate-binding protein [Pseudomonadota bacterium]